MGHFAKVNSGTVEKVIVAEQDFIDSGAVGDASLWVRCSYNTRGGKHYVPNSNMTEESADQSKALRKNFPGPGYKYDGTGFYLPQPFASWTLNSSTYYWEAPLTYPTDGKVYRWNEDNYQADNTTGWEEVIE